MPPTVSSQGGGRYWPKGQCGGTSCETSTHEKLDAKQLHFRQAIQSDARGVAVRAPIRSLPIAPYLVLGRFESSSASIGIPMLQAPRMFMHLGHYAAAPRRELGANKPHAL